MAIVVGTGGYMGRIWSGEGGGGVAPGTIDEDLNLNLVDDQYRF